MAKGVVVDFKANTAQFTNGVDTSVMSLNKLRSQAATAGKAIGVAFAAATAAAAILVKQSINSADAMSKMAQSTGIAIDKLSGLAYAGRLADVEVEALGSAMVKMTKGMADASAGTGEAMRGFDALGINIKDSAGNLKNADLVFSELVGKFSGMEDGANKTALAVAIFGKSGAAMIPMLNSGADGLAQMHEEASKLGLVLDSETGQAAERFNDNLTRLNAVKEGFANQIMKAMLPSLENLSVAMFDSASNTGGLDSAVRVTAAGIKLLMSAAAGVIGTFKSYGEAIGGAAAATVAFFSGDFKGAASIAGATVSDFGANVAASIAQIDAIWDEQAAKVEAKAPETGRKLAAPMMKSLEEINKAKKAAQVEADKMAKDAMKRLEDQNRDIQASALSAQQIFADVDPIYKAGLAWEKYMELVEGGYLDLETAAKHYAQSFGETTKDALDKADKSFERFSENIQRNFGDILFKSLDGGFKGIADSFKEMTLRMMADAAAANLTKALFGDKRGEGFLGEVGGSIAAAVFAPRAAGGPVSSGTTYLVGERGPELFTPSGSGNITPNDKLGGKSTTVRIVQNINIDSRSDQSSIMGAIMRAKDMAKAEIMDSLQRGGQFAQATGRAR